MQQNRKIIYRLESGSHLYGTATAESDVDFSSVFMPTTYDLLSLQKCDYINESTKPSSQDRRNTSEDIDDQQYSLPRFLHLVLHGNPNLLEILFCNKPLIEDPVFTPLKENAYRFVAKHIYHSFTGFAVSQKKKLEYKSKRFKQLLKTVEYLETHYSTIIIDPKAQMEANLVSWLNANLSEYKGDKRSRQSFHEGLPVKIIYEKIKSECENYGWRVRTDTFLSLGYDAKFAAHTVRLFYEGIQLLTKRALEFPITGQAYEDIMAIRRGEVALEEFYRICDRYDEANKKALAQTNLPDAPDWKWANQYLVDTLEKHIVSTSLHQTHIKKTSVK